MVTVEKVQKTHESRLESIDLKMELIIKQHLEIVKSIRSISQVQADIAKQILNQHEEVDQLYKSLGLRKDLSHYSYNMMKEKGH
jgi:hypothetical protein